MPKPGVDILKLTISERRTIIGYEGKPPSCSDCSNIVRRFRGSGASLAPAGYKCVEFHITVAAAGCCDHFTPKEEG